MVTTLVGGREGVVIGSYYVKFKLAHGVEFKPGSLSEGLAGFFKGVFRGVGKAFAVFVKECTEHGDGRDLGKRIDKRCRETGQHIEVAVGGIYVFEEA